MYLHVHAYTHVDMSQLKQWMYMYMYYIYYTMDVYTCLLYNMYNTYVFMYNVMYIKNYIHVYLWGTAAVDVPVLCDCHLSSTDRVCVPPDPRMVLGGQR